MIASELVRLKREYKEDIANNNIKSALSKMHDICGMSIEMMKKEDIEIVNELEILQKRYNEENSNKIEKLKAKKQDKLTKLETAHYTAIAGDNFKKAEKLSIKICDIYEKTDQFYGSYISRKKQIDYRKKSLGIFGNIF